MQLTFDLPARVAQGREDFLVSDSNTLAVSFIDNWADWPQGRFYIYGPERSGKSHLAASWMAQSGAVRIAASALNTIPIPELVQTDVVVEDIERLPPSDETHLFHLLNFAQNEGRRLLMTARHAAKHLRITLPDLASRLIATASAEVKAPDDTLLAALFEKQFADRQIRVHPSVISYLITRMERSFAAVDHIVTTLDREALRRKVPITKTLAREVLFSLHCHRPVTTSD